MSIFFVGNAGAQTGTLIITSHPSAALVYINEKLAGTTPLILPLDPGVYMVCLRKEGYIDHIQQILFRGDEQRIHFRLRILGTPDYRVFDRCGVLGLPTAYIPRKGEIGVSFGTRVLELSVGLPFRMTMLRLFNVGLGLRQEVVRDISLDFSVDYKKKFVDLFVVYSMPNLKYAFHTFAGVSNKKLDYGIVNEYALTTAVKLLSGYRYRNGGWSVGVDLALSKHMHIELYVDKNLKIYVQIGHKIGAL